MIEVRRCHASSRRIGAWTWRAAAGDPIDHSLNGHHLAANLRSVVWVVIVEPIPARIGVFLRKDRCSLRVDYDKVVCICPLVIPCIFDKRVLNIRGIL